MTPGTMVQIESLLAKWHAVVAVAEPAEAND